MNDQAHTRRGDPGTSHEAAQAVSPDLRVLQARVANYARSKGPAGFCDAEMTEELDDPGSTMRTRRAELHDMCIILDSGRRKKWGESPRNRIVWVHRDFYENAPPFNRPAASASAADRQEATALGNSLVSIANGFRRQGFAAAAAQIERGGEMLRRFGS